MERTSSKKAATISPLFERKVTKMSKATAIIAFVIGAAGGAAAAWYITKTKYERIAQEEIDSVKETFSKLYKRDNEATESSAESDDSTDEDEEEPEEPLSVMEYAIKIRNEGYAREEVKEEGELPYVIAPESFDEMDGYSVLSFTYYADKVLTDDRDRAIDDITPVVGFADAEELESHFGEHEDDSIFVRDDRLKRDIEILYDTRKFADVLAAEPYKAGV